MDLNLKANETDILKFSELLNNNLKISKDLIQANFIPTKQSDAVTNKNVIDTQNFSLNKKRVILNSNDSVNLTPEQIVNKILIRESNSTVIDTLPSRKDIIDFLGESFKYFDFIIINNSSNTQNPPVTIFLSANDNNFIGYDSDVLIFPGAIGVFRVVLNNNQSDIYYTNGVT
jgi:hypothetical protein